MIGCFRFKSKGSVEQRRDDKESPETVEVVKRDKLVLQTSPYKLHYSSSSVRNVAYNICASQFIITWSYFSQLSTPLDQLQYFVRLVIQSLWS